MAFKKGYKHTEEWKRKMSEITKNLWKEGKMKGMIGKVSWNKGKKATEKQKEALTLGRKFSHSIIANGKRRQKMLGEKNWNYKRDFSEEHRKRIGLAQRGKRTGVENNMWKGGISKLRYVIRGNFKYRQWRSDVFTRDDFTCQQCGERGSQLVSHHIKAFSKIISEYKILTLNQALSCDELWNINNGLTLCRKCHKKTDNYLKNGKHFARYYMFKEEPNGQMSMVI